MKENDIIKALTCCAANDCRECPFRGEETVDDCTRLLSTHCLDLINKKNEEIATAKETAINEFSERLIALWKDGKR